MASKSAQSKLDRAAARDVATDVLTWLAGEPDLIARFLSLTGLTVDTLRQSAASDGFHLALLDFLMGHEPTLIQFCEATGTPPERIGDAHRALAGRPGLDTNAF